VHRWRSVPRPAATRRRLPIPWAAVLVGIGLAAGLGAAIPPALAAEPPKVTLEPASRDLGVVGLGEEAVAEFLVRNDGGAPLTLALPDPPPGLAAEGLAPEVAPGGSIRLRVRVDTLRARDTPQQWWTLVTNDPDRPRVTLEIQLEVRPFLLVRPGYARYITVQRAREGTIAETVGAADGATFRVLGVVSPAPHLRVVYREARPEERQPGWAGSQWRVEVTLASDSPVGPLTGMIVVNTDHPRQHRAFIPLSGFVRPILAVTPTPAQLGDLDRRRTVPLRLSVKNFAEESIELTDVSTDVAAVRVVIEPVEPGRAWHLALLPAPEAPLGQFEGTIRLRTASPKLPSLEVPLSGRIVESPPAPPPPAPAPGN